MKLKIPKFKTPKMKNSFVSGFLLSVFLAAFFGFLFGGVVTRYFITQSQGFVDFDLIELLKGEIEKSVSPEEAVVRVVKQASPAVVSIIVSKDLPIIEKFFYNPFQELEQKLGRRLGFQVPGYRELGTEKINIGGGTGFIVSPNGLVITNKHVVLDESAEYTVLTNDGEIFETVVLDRDSNQDIAVLEIVEGNNFPFVKMGNSDSLEIGQTVIAIGNVLGEFRNSISVGIISGLQRTISASGSGFSEVLENVIQTDAAINKGNSGGPLLNLRGEVIAMNTATALEAENVGFAIPINLVKRDVESVKRFGEIIYPFLGVYYTLINPSVAQEHNLLTEYGAWVGRNAAGEKVSQPIFSNSPAEKAGLKLDDIILEFNGEKIDLENSLAELIMKYMPGDSVSLKILRGEETKIFNIILDKQN